MHRKTFKLTMNMPETVNLIKLLKYLFIELWNLLHKSEIKINSNIWNSKKFCFKKCPYLNVLFVCKCFVKKIYLQKMKSFFFCSFRILFIINLFILSRTFSSSLLYDTWNRNGLRVNLPSILLHFVSIIFLSLYTLVLYCYLFEIILCSKFWRFVGFFYEVFVD